MTWHGEVSQQRGVSAVAAQTEVHTICRWCGQITLSSTEIRAEVDPRNRTEGLCEFACPSCGRFLIVRTSGDVIRAVHRAGAGRIGGCVPFELLETNSGPPLSWQEVLDLHMALSHQACPQELLAVQAGRTGR